MGGTPLGIFSEGFKEMMSVFTCGLLMLHRIPHWGEWETRSDVWWEVEKVGHVESVPASLPSLS